MYYDFPLKALLMRNKFMKKVLCIIENENPIVNIKMCKL